MYLLEAKGITQDKGESPPNCKTPHIKEQFYHSIHRKSDDVSIQVIFCLAGKSERVSPRVSYLGQRSLEIKHLADHNATTVAGPSLKNKARFFLHFSGL